MISPVGPEPTLLPFTFVLLDASSRCAWVQLSCAPFFSLFVGPFLSVWTLSSGLRSVGQHGTYVRADTFFGALVVVDGVCVAQCGEQWERVEFLNIAKNFDIGETLSAFWGWNGVTVLSGSCRFSDAVASSLDTDVADPEQRRGCRFRERCGSYMDEKGPYLVLYVSFEFHSETDWSLILRLCGASLLLAPSFSRIPVFLQLFSLFAAATDLQLCVRPFSARRGSLVHIPVLSFSSRLELIWEASRDSHESLFVFF